MDYCHVRLHGFEALTLNIPSTCIIWNHIDGLLLKTLGLIHETRVELIFV